MVKKKSPRATSGRRPRSGNDGASQNPAPPKPLPDNADVPSKPGLFPIVAIGASAGGLAALKELFARFPNDSGFAFVVVVHLSPEHKSHLPELLQPFVKMPVQQVTRTVSLKPNQVYVIPPNANLDTIDTHLRLTQLEKRRQERAPIDHFFRTLAKTHDGQAIGIILTGTGSDGTLGLREIKEHGGLTVVQDPNEAEYDGMPQSAIASGYVDVVLPLAKIPQAVLQYVRTQPKLPVVEESEEIDGDSSRVLQKVFAQIRARTGRDFNRYKRSTILRRIQRRMQLRQVEEFPGYLEILREQPDEVRNLADELLITVTSFFRDPEVYQKLEKEIIPQLFHGKGPDDEIRIWSVGCATGEEAYSLAILLTEAASRREDVPLIQLFASDVHEHSLKKARDGFYPGDIETDVTPERLKRFFTKETTGYRIRKEIREAVIFAPHNLFADPPLSRLDLIACRNVLIYIQRDVQRDLVEIFHYALRPNGYLVLGTSETIEGSDLFLLQDKKTCIYRKRNVPALEPRLPVFPFTRARVAAEADRIDRPKGPIPYGTVHQRMVELVAPPSALVSPDDKVVHLSEHAGRFLVHPGGELTASVVKLVREELRIDLRSMLHAARESGQPVRSKPILVRIHGEPSHVVLHVRPATEPNQDGFVLVIFDERGQPEQDSETNPAADTSRRAPKKSKPAAREQELEAELDLVKQRLQAIIEEYETSQEEMKASNEEMQSTNEELRSTMEELETSKEELQSMNEELQTVNQENRHKVEELAQLSGDLQNLLSATNIATLFLDRELRIMRFTPKVSELFNVRMTDRSRPITDLTHRLGYSQLQDDAVRVLEQLVPAEREVQDESGRWYLTRVMPYRSSEDRIEGVVITFVDITDRKRYESSLRESKEIAERVVAALPIPTTVINADLRVVMANEAFYQLFQVPPRDIEGRLFWDLADGAWDVPPLRELLDDVFAEHESFSEFEVEHRFEHAGLRTMRLHARPLEELDLAVVVIQDITQHRREEQALQFLADASAVLAELNEFERTLHLLADAAVPAFADWCSVYGVEGDTVVRRITSVHADPSKQRLADVIREKYPPTAATPRGVVQVARTGNSEIVTSVTDTHLAELATGAEHLRLLRGLDLQSYMCVPLRARGRTLAVLCFAYSDSGRRYTNLDLAVAEELARRTAIASENAQLYQEVREADQRKDEFLAMLAHELRNPLTPIRSGLEILELRPDSQKDLVRQMQIQVNHLVRLVDDLLDVARVARGKISLQIEPLDVALVVRRAVDAVHECFPPQHKNLRVVLPDEPVWVGGDPVRLVQVVQNLLTNAAKYTNEGGDVEICATRDVDHVVITVQDDGIGIEPSLLPKIFELFTQSSRSLDRSQGGLGIGLTLVKNLVEMHGGSVAAHSEGQGKGSLFTVRLPLSQAPSRPVAAPPELPPQQPRRILIVDDNEDAAKILSVLLERIGNSSVRIAGDGPAALALVHDFRPEIILLDIGLPGMDGYEVARTLRQRGYDGLLVALTGYGREADRQKSRDAGCDEHVVKPPDFAALEQLLRHPKFHAAADGTAGSERG